MFAWTRLLARCLSKRKSTTSVEPVSRFGQCQIYVCPRLRCRTDRSECVAIPGFLLPFTLLESGSQQPGTGTWLSGLDKALDVTLALAVSISCSARASTFIGRRGMEEISSTSEKILFS